MIASIASEGQRVGHAPFGKALVELAANRPEIVGLTADLGKYTHMHLFAQAYPERFFQMGMAETSRDGRSRWHGQRRFDALCYNLCSVWHPACL